MIVLDSSVVIDILRSHPGAVQFVDRLRELPVCSEVTRAEILAGVRPGERDVTENLFAATRWIPVEEEIARRAGALGSRWRRSHPGLDVADLIIAATAEELGARLATTNVKHFPMFPGLRAPYRG